MDFSSLELDVPTVIGTYLDCDENGGDVIEVAVIRSKSEFGDRDLYTLYERYAGNDFLRIGFRYYSMDKVLDGIEHRFGHLKTFEFLE